MEKDGRQRNLQGQEHGPEADENPNAQPLGRGLPLRWRAIMPIHDEQYHTASTGVSNGRQSGALSVSVPNR